MLRVRDLQEQIFDGQFPCLLTKDDTFLESMVSLRDGREGPLLAIHVHIAIVAVDFHIKASTVAGAVDLELELVPLVPVRVYPLWVEDGVIFLQFVKGNTNQICQVCLQFH